MDWRMVSEEFFLGASGETRGNTLCILRVLPGSSGEKGPLSVGKRFFTDAEIKKRADAKASAYSHNDPIQGGGILTALLRLR